MEKGSFQNHQQPENVRATDELVRNIPLPNQMPRSLDFLDLPSKALKSSTLDSLIGQNEDLMARLSVTLRKTNELEESNSVLEKENLTFRGKFEALREQFLILKEKDKRFTERTRELAEESKTSQEALEKLQEIYADLYSQARAFQAKVVHLERYRARVAKAKTQIQARAKKVPQLEKSIDRLESNLIETRKILTASHISAVNTYESRLAEKAELIGNLQGKADERDQIFDDNVRLKNELIFEQRQLNKTRDESQTAIQNLSEETRDMRVQLKDLLVLEESIHRENRDLKKEIPDLRQENQILREQVESLQSLWTGKQRELEAAFEKNAALQKLNQSLGMNLNTQRRDIQRLKDENEQENFKNEEKIKKLLAEIQMLRAESL